MVLRLTGRLRARDSSYSSNDAYKKGRPGEPAAVRYGVWCLGAATAHWAWELGHMRTIDVSKVLTVSVASEIRVGIPRLDRNSVNKANAQK